MLSHCYEMKRDWSGAGPMIITVDTVHGLRPSRRHADIDNRFSAVLAQYAPTPLFAPWPATDLNARAGAVSTNAALNTHPSTSNRREGRHARG